MFMVKEYTREDFNDPKIIQWVKAMAKVFFGGNEDVAWEDVFRAAKLDDLHRAQEKQNIAHKTEIQLSIKKKN